MKDAFIVVGAWWCVVVRGGAWWYVVVRGAAWWCFLVRAGAWCCVVVLFGAWWCVVVRGGAWWCVADEDDEAKTVARGRSAGSRSRCSSTSSKEGSPNDSITRRSAGCRHDGKMISSESRTFHDWRSRNEVRYRCDVPGSCFACFFLFSGVCVRSTFHRHAHSPHVFLVGKVSIEQGSVSVCPKNIIVPTVCYLQQNQRKHVVVFFFFLFASAMS